jgi:hypothetical protein
MSDFGGYADLERALTSRLLVTQLRLTVPFGV